MNINHACILEDRGILFIDGVDVKDFLQTGHVFVGRCFSHYLEIVYRYKANITSKEIKYIQGFLNQI